MYWRTDKYVLGGEKNIGCEDSRIFERKTEARNGKFLDRNYIVICPDLLYMGNILLAQNLNTFYPAG
jgi:hypothetical protein